jgi:hypothetical protein
MVIFMFYLIVTEAYIGSQRNRRDESLIRVHDYDNVLPSIDIQATVLILDDALSEVGGTELGYRYLWIYPSINSR